MLKLLCQVFVGISYENAILAFAQWNCTMFGLNPQNGVNPKSSLKCSPHTLIAMVHVVLPQLLPHVIILYMSMLAE